VEKIEMREISMQEQEASNGGSMVVPGTVVTRAVMMDSWTPWTMGVAAFIGGFKVGTYIYNHFGTEIGDGIDAVVN
jgi:hypothetical protein